MSGKMPITWKFSLRALVKNPTRTAVTIVGIALSAALLTAVLVSASSMMAFLSNEEIATQGTWHAYVTTSDTSKVEEAEESGHVSALSVVSNVGFADPNEATESTSAAFGSFLLVQSIDNNFEKVCALPLSSGRLPQNSHEIVLMSAYESSTVFSEEPCEIGSSVTLNLGTISQASSHADPEETAASLTDGADTSSSTGDAGDAGTSSNTSDANVQPAGTTTKFSPSGISQTYTVVGFYQITNLVSYTNLGTKGFTFRDAQTKTVYGTEDQNPTSLVFFTTTGFSSQVDICDFAAETFDVSSSQVMLHSNLLRFSGIGDNRAIWSSLLNIVAILAVIIVVASASLIYNSFAISVAERTRQFGLLLSIGASRKQIRSTVYAEAFLLSLVGIPAGLALGAAGTFMVLNALSPALSKVMGGSGLTQFGMHLDATCLLAAAAFALVAVAVSAWVPSHRAAKVSAIDALRNVQDTKPSRSDKRSAMRGTQTKYDNLWKPKKLAIGARIIGVPALLAQKNARRNKGKGRVATASLLLAIVLLTTVGSLSLYLNRTLDAISPVIPYDIFLSVYFDEAGGEQTGAQATASEAAAGDSAATETGTGESAADAAETDATPAASAAPATSTAGETAATGTPPETSTLQAAESESAQTPLLHPSLPSLTSLYSSFSSAENVTGAGLFLAICAPASIPADMAGKELASLPQTSTITHSDKTVDTQVYIAFIDDESYKAYLSEQELDEEKYTDASHPVAIAASEAYTNDGRMYQVVQTFTRTGFIDLYVYRPHNGTAMHSHEYAIAEDKLGVSYFDDSNAPEEENTVSREDGASIAAELEIGALTRELPRAVSTLKSYPVVMMPLSFASIFGFGESSNAAESNSAAGGDEASNSSATSSSYAQAQALDINTSISFNAAFLSEDHAEVTEQITRIMEQTGYAFMIYDAAESQEMSRLVVVVVETFMVCFAAILTLIAIANVFNTLVSSFSLHRREFAVLKSVGMSTGAFNRMIVWECLRYNARALVGGLAVSMVIAYLMYCALGESIDGLAFEIPWNSIGIAIAVALVTTTISAAYGMRRANKGNIIESLRL